MHEVTVELLTELAPEVNTTNLLLDRVARGSDQPLFSVQREGSWHDVSAGDFLADVKRLATTLINDGLQPGDKVAIVSRTRYEWALAEEAIWFAGGISVPIYETSSPFQIEWILRDSGARVVFAEDHALRANVRQAAAQLGEEILIHIFEGSDQSDKALIPSAGLHRLLVEPGEVNEQAIESRRSSMKLEDVATMVYTSGTTGRPKGCNMTHANFAMVAHNLAGHMREVLGDQRRTLMFLPLAHVLARAVQQTCIHGGSIIAHSSSMAHLVKDMAAVKPGFLLAVPRVFEKIRTTALATAESSGKAGLFLKAEQTAIDVSKIRDARARGLKARLPLGLRARHALFNKVLYPKLRGIFGGECSYAISGASALNQDLAHFFRGAGIQLVEGYGLTETTAPATVNQASHTRVGTVGRPIPGTSVRIADDGEILVKGIGVFSGYHNNPQATAEAFDAGGYFKTGDTGVLDESGYLKVTGRKKELIVTAGGKNVSPGPLEEMVRAGRIVAQCVLVGEQRPFISALVTLDHEELVLWGKAKGLGELSLAQAAVHPEVIAEIQQYVDTANLTVSKAESIRKFVVLAAEFTEASGHLTSSLKLKRQSVLDQFEDRIQEFYSK
ncbi:AMP-dependent synthetase/ligase [Glutamicibacter sp. FBE19]|uniref:AMP-dependent synthetase/ligase n=1 Tax=Glutamicibacter sp. FBE19 TaxID=2761534 RepID=UPI0018964E14|nr:AMP-dependent synthetase/ligase [Glutamicibacter sp. FBE19]MBF6671335.1 long-chain fatty acid--CoA ligase [Glutamicibacter sp. FBE19]